MSLDNAANGGGEGDSTPVTVVTPTGPINNTRDASREISAFRRKQAEQPEAPATAPQEQPAVEPPQELADEASAAPQEIEATGETQEANPAEEPLLELPRSWSKDAAERWSKLDRDTQQFLLDRDRTDSATVRNAQNEAAEQRKALDTEKSAAAQARQQYENALPALLQALQDQQAGEFSDIKSMADVERLANEDWPRYARWDVQQKKVIAIQQEVRGAQERQVQEHQQQWDAFSKAEDQKLLDKVPELADQAKAGKLRESALTTLKDIGFSEQELVQAWNGRSTLSIRDHRVQLAFLDAAKYREGQKAVKQAVAKPLPPVLRPGTAKPSGEAHDQQTQSLKQRLDRTGNWKDAAALLIAQRKAARQ